MSERKIIGVDMGGTKIHTSLILGKEIIFECILDTPAKESEKVVLDRLIKAIEQVYQPGCEGIGIGVPSVVDWKEGIVYDVVAIPSWKEVHVKKILEDHFKIPVYVNNDSNCFALGENFFGKGIDAANFVGVTIGTGLGSGIIIENKLYQGVNTGAGEIGSISYKDGIIEQYCASEFFISRGLDGEELYLKAKKGDPEALEIFKDYGKNLSEVVKIVLYAYDPETIILGGSISNAYEFFIDAVWQGLQDFMFPVELKKLKIEKSELKNSAVLGAAALVYNFNLETA
ncbi:glucokinase [Flavobacterium sp. 90]|uniref:ROK family protein n=1 Tax=unclassified Flavobacterium TaxID=196869 RepID=UPI000EAF563F|nr:MULTISPECIES: ROK family protein [unclassified Flavobacterium]RKR09805.1 glucokinase [Flavobacterium sp. 81]TCK53591.1 glucokinase [Flavobacterium sp. 90]